MLKKFLDCLTLCFFLFYLSISSAFSSVFGISSAKQDYVPLSSVAANYLAAYISYLVPDFLQATNYYEDLVSLDPSFVTNPENINFKLDLKQPFILSQRFDALISLFKKDPKSPDFVFIVHEIKNKHYKNAAALMKDIDKKFKSPPQLISIFKAWLEFSTGNTQKAFSLLGKVENIYLPFALYHKALMQNIAGLTKEAEKTYALIFEKYFTQETDMFRIRFLETYIPFLVEQQKKKKATLILRTIKKEISHPFLDQLEKKLSSDTLPPSVKNYNEGFFQFFLSQAIKLIEENCIEANMNLSYALALMPKNETILFQLAETYENSGYEEFFQEAINMYKKIPTHSPLKSAADIQIAFILSKMKKPDEAIKTMKEYLRNHPDDIKGFVALGDFYALKDDFDNALVIYNQIIEMAQKNKSQNWEFFYKRGVTYEQLKNWSKASSDFHTALRLSPNQPFIMNSLGYSWLERKYNMERALKLIQKAHKIFPGDAFILDSLGWAYFLLNRFDEAVKALETAVSLHPQDPTINDHLGDAYWCTNRRREARFQWSDALTMNPKKEKLKEIEQKILNGLPDKNHILSYTFIEKN